MTTLKNNKVLQFFISTVFAILLLLAGFLLSEKIPFPETSFWSIAKTVLLIGYLPIYVGALSLLAIFSKAKDLKFLYYPAFAICLNSVASAIIDYNIETSTLILLPFTKYFGLPLRSFATALDKATTYTAPYGYDETILWQYDILGILLVMTLASVAIYQIYTETDDHVLKKTNWRIEGLVRKVTTTLICAYGGYSLLVYILYLLPDLTVLNMIYTIVALLSMYFTIFLLTLILPLVLIPLLIVLALKQVRRTKNLRHLFNPLIILAIFITIAGSWAIFTTTTHCF